MSVESFTVLVFHIQTIVHGISQTTTAAINYSKKKTKNTHTQKTTHKKKQHAFLCAVCRKREVDGGRSLQTESEKIQSAAITGNNRGMNDSIKKALGPTLNKTAPSNLQPGKLSQVEDISWKDGWNTTPISTPERTLCYPLPLMLSNACRPWKNKTQSQFWRSSARPLTAWPLARHLAARGNPQTSPSTARPPYCILCMHSSVSAGKKELYHKTCGMPRSSHSSRTRERGVTATTETSPFSVSSAKSLQKS